MRGWAGAALWLRANAHSHSAGVIAASARAAAFAAALALAGSAVARAQPADAGAAGALAPAAPASSGPRRGRQVGHRHKPVPYLPLLHRSQGPLARTRQRSLRQQRVAPRLGRRALPRLPVPPPHSLLAHPAQARRQARRQLRVTLHRPPATRQYSTGGCPKRRRMARRLKPTVFPRAARGPIRLFQGLNSPRITAR